MFLRKRLILIRHVCCYFMQTVSPMLECLTQRLAAQNPEFRANGGQ